MSDLRFNRLLSKESDSSTWVSQSKGFWPAEFNDPLFYTFIYLVIAFSGAILIHSALLHKRVYKAVRIHVDISAVCGILIGIMVLISYDRPNPTKRAIMRDLFAFGFLQATVQYCDTYMFYKSYAVVVKVPAWKRYLIFSYVSFVVILTYFFKWNIIPFFSSPSNPKYIAAFFILDQISYYGVILFNFTFTVGFVWELVRISGSAPNQGDSKNRNRTRLLISSAIGHCVTSSFANLYRTLAVTDSASFPEWIFILVVGLHIWFNMKIEKMYGFMMTCKRVTFSATDPHSSDTASKTREKHISGYTSHAPNSNFNPKHSVQRNKVVPNNIPLGCNSTDVLDSTTASAFPSVSEKFVGKEPTVTLNEFKDTTGEPFRPLYTIPSDKSIGNTNGLL